MWHPETGTKIVLEHEAQGRILVCQRDDDPSIPYPGMWDLPGGGAEPGESLLDCAYRELTEEFGLTDVNLVLLDAIPSQQKAGKVLGRAYGRLTARHVGSIVFGPEGQGYGFFTPAEIADMDFVPQLQEYVLALYGIHNRVRTLEQSA